MKSIADTYDIEDVSQELARIGRAIDKIDKEELMSRDSRRHRGSPIHHAELRARAEVLERHCRSERNRGRAPVRAELKAEAIRAGMVDLDGLKLINSATICS